jgi:hypothetical protein
MSLQLVTTTSPEAHAFVPPAEPLPAPQDPWEQTIAQVAEELGQLRNASAMKLTLEVGALVVKRIFQGDLERVRSQGRKDNSFRRLAAHPKLPFSPMRLWRAVGVYELVSRMPGLPNTKNLTVSHLYTVLGLPHETQEWLLRAANEHGWSVVELDHKANNHRSKRAKRNPQPLLPVLQSLREIERFTSRLELNAELRAEDDTLDQEQVRRVQESIDRIRAWCDELGHLLERRASTIE